MGMRPAVISHIAWGALRSMTLHAWRSEAGHESFIEAFRPEGLVPMDPAGREVAPIAGRCLGCGACERTGLSPRAVLEASRGLHHLGHAARQVRALAGLGAPALEELESACPARIPFGRIAVHLGHLLDTGPELG